MYINFFLCYYINNMEVEVMDSKGILFYTIDGKLITNLASDNNLLDEKKEIKTSKEFNKALRKVTQKDIDLLQRKITNIIKEIKKMLAMNNILIEQEIEKDINKIDNIINDLEELTSKLIIDKSSIKVGVFSSNKKDKKKKIKNLEKSIETLSEYQKNIISIKNEYNKLVNRSNNIDELQIYDIKKKEKKKEDPLERTINFYMNRKS